MKNWWLLGGFCLFCHCPFVCFFVFLTPPTTKVPRGFIVCTLQVHSLPLISYMPSISITGHVIIEIILSGRKQEDRNAKQNERMIQQSLLYSMTNRTSEQLQGVVLTRGQKLFFSIFKEKRLLKWIIQSIDPSLSEYLFGKLISFCRF